MPTIFSIDQFLFILQADDDRKKINIHFIRRIKEIYLFILLAEDKTIVVASSEKISRTNIQRISNFIKKNYNMI